MKRRPLTRERIIAAAIAMADRDGFEQVTLRRLAAGLGVHVTSLYNHVPTRDAVIEGMAELIVAQADMPVRVKDWEDWIRRIAKGFRQVGERHPGAAAAFFRQPARGPLAAEVLEAALAAFEEAGFSPAAAYLATRATFVTVLGLMANDLARHQQSAVRSEWSDVPSEQYPHVHRLGAVVGRGDPWKFAVDALVAGIAAQRDSLSSPRARSQRSPR